MSEINRLIAEKLMGFDTDYYHEFWYSDDIAIFANERTNSGYETFDPEHNISHAHMALEKFVVWIVEKFPSDNEYICKVWKTPDYIIGPFEGLGATPQTAICEAIKAALEGRNEGNPTS